MDISQKREISQDLLKYVSLLKFKNKPIILAGTAGLASQRYFSDFDLLSIIDQKYTNEEVYNEIMKILNNTEKLDDMYFLELKIQNKVTERKKHKFYKIKDITKKAFLKSITDLERIKIDYIIRLNNKFIELSIIYSFTDTIDEKNLMKSLNEDIKQLQKDGNFYKSIKRLFSIYHSLNLSKKLWSKDKMIKIVDFLNTDIGRLYQDTANLKAIKLLLENYNDSETIKRAQLNLKDLKLQPNLNKIDEIIKKNETKFNKAGYDFLQTLK